MLQNLRIVGNNRAVEMVVSFLFVDIIAAARIENGFHVGIDEILNVSVHQFCRVADGITWYGRLSREIGFPGGERRNNDFKTQGGKESMPKGELFQEIQLKRNSNFPSLVSPWFELRKIVLFERKDIQKGWVAYETLWFDDPVTFVAADQLPVVVEAIDGEQAVVGASFAIEGFGCMHEMLELVLLQQGGGEWYVFMLLLCIQSAPIRSHEPCLVKPDDFGSEFHLKGPEYCIVKERSTLYDNMLAEHGRVRGTYDFI